MEIKITIQELESMLRQQKELVINKLLGQSSYYNLESDEGTYKTLPINKEKFKEAGMESRYPDEFVVLKKYVR